MNLWLRLLWVALHQRRDDSADVLDEVRLKFHVMPHDLDLLLHMNNGRYLTLMDLGRFALIRRTGALVALRRHGAIWLLGGIAAHYIRPLKLFQRVELTTRVVSWDEKWIYLEQRFERGDTLHCRAFARVLARGTEGNVPTRRVLQLIGAGELEPPQAKPAEFDSG